MTVGGYLRYRGLGTKESPPEEGPFSLGPEGQGADPGPGMGREDAELMERVCEALRWKEMATVAGEQRGRASGHDEVTRYWVRSCYREAFLPDSLAATPFPSFRTSLQLFLSTPAPSTSK